MRRLATLAVLALAMLLQAGLRPVAAERLVVSLSNHRVQVTSNFTGEDLVLFGTIEPDKGATTMRRGDYDLVVTVTGPRRTYRTRRKSRTAGIWVNSDSREFVNVPSYLAVLSNRPVKDIAKPDVLRRLQIGLDNFILTQHIGPDFADTVPDDPFRVAFVRLKSDAGLYRQSPTAVTFLTRTVYRAAIPLPADVRTGTYDIDVKLFSAGAMIAQTKTALEVTKTGFEQYVADGAADYGLIYGFATVLMALSIGWIASVMFRKD
ncbi:MAG TPA: TIGR02186 family protein [Pseudolabrys sp.]|nr:TIGR02186 family protein [Pseudolabrys sp.]